jgi:hypothetical protein
MIQANQEGFKLNGTHKRMVYFDDVNILGESIVSLLVTSKKTNLEINAEKIKHMFLSHEENAGLLSQHTDR